MKACYNCQQLYEYGEVCPMCGDYLFDYDQPYQVAYQPTYSQTQPQLPAELIAQKQAEAQAQQQAQQQAQAQVLAAQMQNQAYQSTSPASATSRYDFVAMPAQISQPINYIKSKGVGKTVVIIILSVLLLLALGAAGYLFYQSNTNTQEASETIVEDVARPTELEQSVVDSAFTYLIKAYNIYESYFTTPSPTPETPQATPEPTPEATPEATPDASGAATDIANSNALTGAVNDSVSAVTALAAFADNDYFESINKPMLSLTDYPNLVQIWQRVPALSTSDTNTNAEDAKARLAGIIEEFRAAASVEGFDTSSWRPI